MNRLVTHLARPLTEWAEESQRRACRNAMVASTRLTARRRERDEAEEFVARLLSHREPRAGAASTLPSTLPAARLG